jgi:hypothetical protein
MNKSHKGKIKLAVKDKKNLFAGQSNTHKDFDKYIFTINFKELFNDNGQHHNEWEAQKLLSQVIDKFKHYCSRTMNKVYDIDFKTYDNWPPSEKTKFIAPKRFPDYEDKTWASMHIRGKPCVIGYMIENVFYITWFDQEHHFWLSPLKNT